MVGQTLLATSLYIKTVVSATAGCIETLVILITMVAGVLHISVD